MKHYNFKEDEMSEVFFTSDTHFYHSNIIKFCERPFSCAEEMNNCIIYNWNKTVPKEGIVFHLGDFAFCGVESMKFILSQLNGHIILIKGNHDYRNIRESVYSYFGDIYSSKEIIVDNTRVYLNHFPYLCFPQDNSIQLFGHIHLSKYKNEGYDFERSKYLQSNQYDVGVDLNDFTPVSWNTIKSRIAYQKAYHCNCTNWIKNDT